MNDIYEEHSPGSFVEEDGANLTRRTHPEGYTIPASAKELQVSVGLRLPLDLDHKLSKASKERDLSKNYIMVRAIEDFLERLIPVEEFKLTRD